MGIVVSLLMFSFIVFVHEMGHLLVGLKMGAEPQEFSVGFGKSIFSKVYKGINFRVGIVPFGGYVKFNKDANHPDPEKRISHLKGILVYLAGPMSNLVLSWFLLFGLVFSVATHPANNSINSGLYNKIDALFPAEENRVHKSFEVTNVLTKDGILFIVDSFKGLTVKDVLTNSSGPVGIVSGTTGILSKTKNSSLYYFYLIYIVIMLSTSLGVTNLLPLGILDGGRIMSSVLKMIFSERITWLLNYYDRLSVLLIFGFFIFVTVNDILGVIHS
jgi:membrane-associated protease RseP (regulator of RpoE activity)